MAQRVVGLTGATLELAPSVCQTCVWWQSRNGRTAGKDRWIEKAATEGVGAAVAERDGLFGDYSQAPADQKPDPANVVDVKPPA